MRITIHLTQADRDLLTALEARRESAAALLAQAERDFAIAGTGMATSRGLSRVDVIDLTAEGLVLEMTIERPTDRSSV